MKSLLDKVKITAVSMYAHAFRAEPGDLIVPYMYVHELRAILFFESPTDLQKVFTYTYVGDVGHERLFLRSFGGSAENIVGAGVDVDFDIENPIITVMIERADAYRSQTESLLLKWR